METTEQEIMKLLKMVKRRGMGKLIKFLEDNDYFTAPASTKFHGNFEGGLAEHSLRVYEALYHLDVWLKTKLELETMIICGLLHDVCKLGIYKKELKEDKSLQWVRNDPFPVGHSEKSITILQEFIKLTPQEIVLIRWHMGAYDPALKQNSRDLARYFPEYKLLYFADDIATQFMEETR